MITYTNKQNCCINGDKLIASHDQVLVVARHRETQNHETVILQYLNNHSMVYNEILYAINVHGHS